MTYVTDAKCEPQYPFFVEPSFGFSKLPALKIPFKWSIVDDPLLSYNDGQILGVPPHLSPRMYFYCLRFLLKKPFNKTSRIAKRHFLLTLVTLRTLVYSFSKSPFLSSKKKKVKSLKPQKKKVNDSKKKGKLSSANSPLAASFFFVSFTFDETFLLALYFSCFLRPCNF